MCGLVPQEFILAIAVLALVAAVVAQPAMPQDPMYHRSAGNVLGLPDPVWRGALATPSAVMAGPLQTRVPSRIARSGLAGPLTWTTSGALRRPRSSARNAVVARSILGGLHHE